MARLCASLLCMAPHCHWHLKHSVLLLFRFFLHHYSFTYLLVCNFYYKSVIPKIIQLFQTLCYYLCFFFLLHIRHLLHLIYKIASMSILLYLTTLKIRFCSPSVHYFLIVTSSLLLPMFDIIYFSSCQTYSSLLSCFSLVSSLLSCMIYVNSCLWSHSNNKFFKTIYPYLNLSYSLFNIRHLLFYIHTYLFYLIISIYYYHMYLIQYVVYVLLFIIILLFDFC